METFIPVIILTALAFILIGIKIYNIINPKIKDPSTKKKKGYDPRNNYFRNNPEHIDMTESYIDSIWEEMRKK